MGYLVAAFTVIWVLTFAFILSIAIRQGRLLDEIARLRAQIDQAGE